MVNDSPALKRADVGFAMGSGTAVAKEAGDIVIVDDNFKSIKDAILYGRTIYHNILKFCKFQLSINVGAVLTSAVLPFIGVEEALTVIHLLFVNLCMDSLGSLMLGMEPAMDYYLDEKPRRRDESIVSKNMFIQFTFMGVYLLILGVVWFTNGFIGSLCMDSLGSLMLGMEPAMDYYLDEKPRRRDESIVSKNMFIQFTFMGVYLLILGVVWFTNGFIGSLFETPEQLKTGFFAAFMFSAIINGLNVRSEGFDIFKGVNQNKNFFKVMLVMLAATVFLCVVGGPIGDVFSCTRFAPIGWVAVIIAGILVIPVDMLRKLIFGTYKETKKH